MLLLLTLAKSSKKKKKLLVTDNKKEIRQKQNLGIGTIVHNLVRCTSWYGMISTVSITDSPNLLIEMQFETTTQSGLTSFLMLVLTSAWKMLLVATLLLQTSTSAVFLIFTSLKMSLLCISTASWASQTMSPHINHTSTPIGI